MTYAKLPYQTLPQSSQLKSGAWVSNYDKLPDTILKAEGWLPLEEVRPVLAANQYHELDTAVQLKDRIVATYKAVTPPPDELAVVTAELDRYKAAVAEATAVSPLALKADLVSALTKLKTATAEIKVAEPIVKEIL